MAVQLIKVAIFSSYKHSDLQSQINNWLRGKSEYEIKNIQYSTSLAEGSHSICSLYSALISYITYE